MSSAAYETRMTHDEATAAHDLDHILRGQAARAREATLREARDKQRDGAALNVANAGELAAIDVSELCLTRKTMFDDAWWRDVAPKYGAQLHGHLFGFPTPTAMRNFFNKAFADKP
jgi:hypothetical protein